MTKTRKHGVSADRDLHPVLKDQVQTLRGGMVGAAEKIPLPVRFVAEAHPDRPAFYFTDTATGRRTLVGLCDYSGVREALAELFPDPTTT